MNDPHLLYTQLLEANEDAFDMEFFVVAYHALSGALNCVLSLQRLGVAEQTGRLDQIEQRVSQQIERLNKKYKEQLSSSEAYELGLYTSLAQIINTQRIIARLKSSS